MFCYSLIIKSHQNIVKRTSADAKVHYLPSYTRVGCSTFFSVVLLLPVEPSGQQLQPQDVMVPGYESCLPSPAVVLPIRSSLFEPTSLSDIHM